MEQFSKNWQNYKIEEVLNLFSSEVEYWETPFKKIEDIHTLRKEWEYIYTQVNIELKYTILYKDPLMNIVIWTLSYTTKEWIEKRLGGIYHIKLDENNICTYFYQCCEDENV
jgi:hypothetical protein